MADPDRRTDRERLATAASYGLLILLFAPFALIYGSALLGFPIMRIPGFGIWFMASLTACGVVATVSMLIEGIRQKRPEWGCMIVIAVATAWWAYVLIRSLK